MPVGGPGRGPTAPEEIRNPGQPSTSKSVVLEADSWIRIEGGKVMICGARYSKLLRDEKIAGRVCAMLEELGEEVPQDEKDRDAERDIQDTMVGLLRECLGE